MKLSSHGYKVKELKMYDMPMGELKLVLLQKMQEKRYFSTKIRIVDITAGEVDEYKNFEEFLMHDFNNYYEVRVYETHSVDIYSEELKASERYIVAVIGEIEDREEVQR